MLSLKELVIMEPCTFIYGKMSIESSNKNGTLAIGEATGDAQAVKIVDQWNGWI
jgi:hypothetical protein